MCCQGHLTGTAHGFEFYPGKSCHFIRKDGCSIYPYRPSDPCKTFKCEWKSNKSFPESYRPDKLKIIFINRWLNDETSRLDVIESGNIVSAEILHFIMQLFNGKQYQHIHYQLNGSWYDLKR
jgi:hypothetical protein